METALASALAIVLFVLAMPRCRTIGRKDLHEGLFLLAAALLLAVPSTTRWLQDGMETSLGVVLALGAVLAVKRWRSRESSASAIEILLTAVALALPAMLRIDLLLISLGAAGLCVAKNRKGRIHLAVVMAGLLAAWECTVWALTGAIVPDTAIAKQGGFSPTWAISFIKSMASTSPLWMLGPILLLAQFATDRGSLKRRSLFLICGGASLAGIIFFGTLKGQSIHGSRYFLAHMAFAWGVVLLAETESADAPNAHARPSRLLVSLLIAGMLLAGIHVVASWNAMLAVARGTRFVRVEQLKRPGVTIAAFDIGYFGWYSGLDSRILDLSGLVNGPTMANLRSGSQRLQYGVALMGFPDVLLINDSQAETLFGNNKKGMVQGPDHQSRSYRNTGTVVLEARLATQQLQHKLWVPEDEGP